MTLGRAPTPSGFFDSANQFELHLQLGLRSRRHIAYFSSGRCPRRARGLNQLLPTLGTGQLRLAAASSRCDEHPHDVDPPGGLLLNWNNKPAPGWHAGDDSHSYGSVHRVQLFDGFAAAGRASRTSRRS